MGEYVAACLAGVFSLENVLQWISRQGRSSDALTCSQPRRKLILPSTGEVATEPPHTEYGRETVRPGTDLSRVERTLAAEGVDTFLEVGPHGSLLGKHSSLP